MVCIYNWQYHLEVTLHSEVISISMLMCYAIKPNDINQLFKKKYFRFVTVNLSQKFAPHIIMFGVHKDVTTKS